ncbi:MAG: putative Chemotaxis regulator CheZ [Nitrospira sp.]|nr:putative Chemotaxis regulator CheZ [Nitrospira sp.]
MAQPRGTAQSRDEMDDPEQDVKAPDTKLYEELGELARFIDTTMKTLSEFSAPVNTSTQQLPQALTHLTNLKTLTEQGTHKVMLEVEAMQDNHIQIGKMIKELAHVLQQAQVAPSLLQQVQQVGRQLGQDDKRLLDIMTALSFQDLVAQSVNKLVTIGVRPVPKAGRQTRPEQSQRDVETVGSDEEYLDGPGPGRRNSEAIRF